jgi:hypothetical protein
LIAQREGLAGWDVGQGGEVVSGVEDSRADVEASVGGKPVEAALCGTEVEIGVVNDTINTEGIAEGKDAPMRRLMLRDSGVASSSPVPSVPALNPRATFENGLVPLFFDAASSEDFLPRRFGFGNKSILIAGVVSASNKLMEFCACDERPQVSRTSGIRTTASFVCNMIEPFYLAVRS